MAAPISVSFRPSAIVPPVPSESAVIFVVGTAPVVQVDVANVNIPVLCNTLGEFHDAFGLADSDEWSTYTLNELAAAVFQLGAASPIIAVNVGDPSNANHETTETSEAQTMAGPADAEFVTLDEKNPILSTIVVKDVADAVTYVLDTDYTLAFAITPGDYGDLIISRITAAAGGSITAAEVLHITYDRMDLDGAVEAGVVAADVIGSVSGSTYTGWETVNQSFPLLRKVPNILTCPVWSETPSVAAVMAAKAASINGMFKACCLADLPADKATIATYAAVPAYIQTVGYTSKHHLNGWPKFVVDSDVYHASSHMAYILSQIDRPNSVPYKSPHNKDLAAGTSIQHDDGTVLTLEPSQANVVKDGGGYTMLKWIGLTMWGTHTGAYPNSTDPTEANINVTRMQWDYNNNLILRNWQRLGENIDRRIINSILASEQQILNQLVAQGALIAGDGTPTITFPEDLNSDTQLLAGQATFLVSWTVPITLERLIFEIQYDASGLSGLFA